MRRARGAVAGAVLAAGGGAAGQTYEYTGLPNASWYVATNWTPNGVPGVNPGGVPVLVQQAPVSLDPGAHATILSLAAPAGMTVNNGLTIALNGAITNGTFKGTDTLSGFQCFGTLNLAGTTTWLGGIVSCGNVIHAGTLNIGGPGGTGPIPQFAGAFHNQGLVNGGFSLRTDALVENAGDWVLGPMGMAAGHTGGIFRNAGDCTRTGGEITIGTGFDNQGNLSLDGAILNLNGFASAIDGVVLLANNGRIRLFQSGSPGAPATLLGFTATGQGDILVDIGNHTVHAAASSQLAANSPFGLWINSGSGTVRLEANMTNSGKATFAGGRLQSDGGAFINTVEGTLTWGTSGSTGAGLTGVLENHGVTIMRGSPRLENGIVTNASGALLDITSGAFSQAAATVNVVQNSGTVRKGTQNSGSTIFGAPLNTSGGRVECERSILSLNGGSDFTGNSVIKVGPMADARLILEGAVTVDTFGEVRVQGGPGAIEVHSAGTLTVVAGGQVINELVSPAEFRIFGGLKCLGGIGFVNEGRLRLQGGRIDGGAGLFAGLENRGDFELNGGTIVGSVLNSGTMLLTFNTGIGENPGESGLIRNVGTFELRNNMQLAMPHAASLLLNDLEGVILKDTPAGNTISGPGVFDNRGTVRVLQGALLLNGPVAQVTNGQLTGGTWTVAPGATLFFPGGVITNLTGQAVVQGNSTSVPAIESLNEIDDASLFVDGLLNLGAGDLGLTNGAVLRIGETGAVSVGGAVINGELEDPLSEIQMMPVVPAPGPGPRLTTPSLQNHATLVPGGHTEPGPFNLTGNLAMFPTGRIIVELGGLTPITTHDRVDITGGAALAGKLEARLIDGFVPALGQPFIVLATTGTVTGTFGSIVQPPNMPAGLKLAPQYGPNSVTLVVQDSCYPDCNGDGALTVADFGCFQTQFVLGTAYADCNGDGVRTVADFGCFQTKFVVGCP